jgi:hypothetical protein
MYLILIKYFYYFYFLKKNKKFKFFILVDLIFFLMKKYFKLLLLKKKLIKYKNILKKSLSKIDLKFKKVAFDKKPTILFKISKQLYLLNKLDNLLKIKINGFNDFIIHFLPSQLLPLGNRKKFYNLINKKFKRFFVLIKKKLNKKFFFFYLVQMFRKIKFLFIKSDAFLNKKTFLFDFFSNLILEAKYSSLLQYYRQHNKKDSFLKNKFLSFFNLMSFFLYRIDYFLYKLLSFFSLSYIRNVVFNYGVFVNNKLVNTTHYFLTKYDLIKLPLFISSSYRKLYIFCIKFYFDFVNKYSYKLMSNVKHKYYLELYKIGTSMSTLNTHYIKQVIKKKHSLVYDEYLVLIENLFYFFFKDKKMNHLYNFDLLNRYKENFNVEFRFPFFLKQKKKDFFFNSNVCYLNNVSFIVNNTLNTNKDNIFNFSYLNNFIHLYFFLSKVKMLYFFSNKNKILVSPLVVSSLIKEQKKLFYYFSILYHINLTKLI